MSDNIAQARRAPLHLVLVGGKFEVVCGRPQFDGEVKLPFKVALVELCLGMRGAGTQQAVAFNVHVVGQALCDISQVLARVFVALPWPGVVIPVTVHPQTYKRGVGLGEQDAAVQRLLALDLTYDSFMRAQTVKGSDDQDVQIEMYSSVV